MKSYILEPEVAGSIYGDESVIDSSVHPPCVKRLDYRFDGWMGDDVLESFPCYIATTKLAGSLKQAGMTGVEFDEVKVSKSEQFEEMYPNRELPTFVWLRIIGQAGEDDFGLTNDNRLVVSERALNRMKEFRLDNCEVVQYEATPVAA